MNNNGLASLVRRYRNNILDKNSVWTRYWLKMSLFTYIPGSLDYIEEYQKFFDYGPICDSDLGDENTIKDQLNINFCNWKPYYLSCITHQLMGIRLLQIKNCDDQAQNTELTTKLVDMVESQLVWDSREGDVYIQRVLMLLNSGNQNKVKTVWLHNILKEQKNR